MASCSPKRIKTYQAGGAINAYSAVKLTSNGTVEQAGANDKAIGIYQGESAAASGEFIEVAIQGGGALLKINENVAVMKLLTSTSTGLGEVADAADEFCFAMAMESGVQNDIIGVEVISLYVNASDA
jgi:hypothetical protein